MSKSQRWNKLGEKIFMEVFWNAPMREHRTRERAKRRQQESAARAAAKEQFRRIHMTRAEEARELALQEEYQAREDAYHARQNSGLWGGLVFVLTWLILGSPMHPFAALLAGVVIGLLFWRLRRVAADKRYQNLRR